MRPYPLIVLREFFHKGGIPGYFFLMGDIISVFTTRQRDPELYASVDKSSVITLAYLAICLFYCIFSLPTIQGKKALRVLTRKPMIFLTLYCCLCVFSSLWSPRIFYTGFRAIECLIYLFLITLLGINLKEKSNKQEQEMVEWVILWALWVVFWGIIQMVKALGISSLATIDVFATGGRVVGMVVFFAFFISRRHILAAILLIFSFLSLINKIYFGFIFGLFSALTVGNIKMRIALPFLTGTLILVFILFGMTSIQKTLWYGYEDVGWRYTNGRDYIWLYSLDLALQKPILGYGFVTGEKEALNSDNMGGVISTHNCFLSAFLGVGIIGPILLFLFFMELIRLVLRANLPERFRAGMMGTIIMALCLSITDPGIGGRVYGSWISVVLTSVFMSIISWNNLIQCSNREFS